MTESILIPAAEVSYYNSTVGAEYHKMRSQCRGGDDLGMEELRDMQEKMGSVEGRAMSQLNKRYCRKMVPSELNCAAALIACLVSTSLVDPSEGARR